jgi:protein-glutamine gamma-glutamyltransferase
MNWRHLDPLLREIGLMKKYPFYLPGDRLYFANPDVDPLTPEWQGENVIDLNGKLYYGHGVGIHDADFIIRSLNENRIESADESAYLMNSAGRPNYKNLFQVSQDH